MRIQRLFQVLVVAGAALGFGACAGAGASGPGTSDSAQQLPDGGTALPPPRPPSFQGGGGPSGW